MKKYLSLILCALLLVSPILLVGCNTEEEPTDAPTDAPTEAPAADPTEEITDAPTDAPTDEPTEKPTDAPRPLVPSTYSLFDDWRSFKTYGRVQYLADGIACDATASGIEFSGYMKDIVEVELKCSYDTYFTVFIDGERVEERLFADADTEYLTIADLGDEPGEHTIRLLKQTEEQWALALIKNVVVTGYLNEDAPADRDFYIEFIGDSLTTGYGNIGNSQSEDPGSAPWQDATQTYAFFACEALEADYTIAACSGVGIDKGYTYFPLKDFYEAASLFRDKKEKHYDPRTPDVVIINIGTNDKDNGSSKTAFKDGVKELILTIRENYGEQVPVIWAYNLGGYGCDDWAFEAIDELGGEESELYCLKMTSNYDGANRHPSVEGHAIAADELVAFIEEKDLLY